MSKKIDIDAVIAKSLPRIRKAILKRAKKKTGLNMRKLPDGMDSEAVQGSLDFFISKISYALLKP